MEGCSKRSAGTVPALPDDPVVEILSRVPAKSVCRFKCVSKGWRDLIDDPDNRKKLRQAMQGLFVQTSEVENNGLNRRDSVSFIDLTLRSVPLDIDNGFSFLTEMTGTFFLNDSCNGLILFRRHHVSVGHIVCNPTTKQWSAVPACCSGETLSYTYLAFDPDVSTHFHLVQFQIPDLYEKVVALHVYSSETGTWSQNQIDGQKEQRQLEGWHHQFTLDNESCFHLRAFVNGFLHVIVSCSDLQQILVVDTQGKARRMIAVPGLADGRPENAFVSYLGQSQGHLHCVTLEHVDNDTDYELSTWVLQDYDTQEWVLKNTVDDLGFSEMVDIHQDCNVLFFLHESGNLHAYDMDRKEVSVIATFKDDKTPWDFVRYIPYFSESLDLTNKY